MEKKPEAMNLPELLDELIDCATRKNRANTLILWFRADRERYESHVTMLERRIEACRDEIARRAGN